MNPPPVPPGAPAPGTASLWAGRGLCLTTALLWSTSGLFIKTLTRAVGEGGEGWPGLQVAGGRSLIAFFAIAALSRSLRRPRARDLVVAVCLAGVMIPYVLAQTYTATANAIMLQYAAPLYVMGLAPLVLGERPALRDFVAGPFLIGGVVMIFLSCGLGGGTLFGNLMGILSGITYAALVVALRKWPDASGPSGLAWGNALAAAVALPLAACGGGGLVAPGPAGGAEVLYLGIVQIGLAWYLFARAMRTLRAIEASFITMAEPVACPLWAFLILGERPAAGAIAGGALLVVTLTLHTVAAARAGRRPRPAGS